MLDNGHRVLNKHWKIPGYGQEIFTHEVFSLLLRKKLVGRMRIISFIEEPKTIDKIIRHLELTFEAERPPPPRVVQQKLLMAAEEMGESI